MFAYSYNSKYRNGQVLIRNNVAFCGLQYHTNRTCARCEVIVDQLLEQGKVRLMTQGTPDLWYVWCAQNGKPVTLKQKRETVKSFLTE